MNLLMVMMIVTVAVPMIMVMTIMGMELSRLLSRQGRIYRQGIFLQQISDVLICPRCRHLEELGVIIDAGHLHVGHIGAVNAAGLR